jgi:hypothetical protein
MDESPPERLNIHLCFSEIDLAGFRVNFRERVLNSFSEFFSTLIWGVSLGVIRWQVHSTQFFTK